MLLQSDITVELSTRDNNLLTGVTQLVLDAQLNDDVVGKVDLLSSEMNPGAWDACKVLVM
jgi:hypothetical protein